LMPVGSFSENDLSKVNIEGTKNLVTACLENGVKRLVLISSVALYLPDSAPADETAALGGGGAYGKSKAGAEAVLRDCAQQNLEWVILRPSTVYGERGTGFTQTLLRMLKWPALVVSGDSWPALELVHAEDLASAALLAGQRTGAAGETYNITGATIASLKDMVRIYKETTGHRKVVISLPRPLLKLALRSRMHSVRCYDINKARKELGYQPQIFLSEGLRRIFEWYRLIPRKVQ
jgi:nucleoside-diphosphate-sugar epimerase